MRPSIDTAIVLLEDFAINWQFYKDSERGSQAQRLYKKRLDEAVTKAVAFISARRSDPLTADHLGGEQ